ncbi:MAG: flagellar hook-basal body complex protein FliE [Caldicoprobacterales bacterium]|nr:flagellar hook-basal body complex protein FliE [Clostridiales bacterium]
MKIDNLYSNSLNLIGSSKTKHTANTGKFKDIFENVVQEVKELREKDITNNTYMAAGQIDSLDKIMIDMEKADIALQFTLQVRSKILDAYQEIMRMQI